MTNADTAFGFSGAAVEVAHAIRRQWETVGLRGGFHARNIDTREDLGFDAEVGYPLASVAKLPLALVALDLMARGELSAKQRADLDPRTSTGGPTGASGFRHPSSIALEDLAFLMLTVSDNAAADALFDYVPPRHVQKALRGWGCDGVVVRHPMRTMYDAVHAVAADDRALALELVIRATTQDGAHVLPALDIASASYATARGLTDLLCRIWTDDIGVPEATGRLRDMMAEQLTSNRIARSLASDAVRVSSKTGTFFNLRHEAGVVTTASGDRVAVTALTASHVPAMLQPEADQAIGNAARDAVDVLRL